MVPRASVTSDVRIVASNDAGAGGGGQNPKEKMIQAKRKRSTRSKCFGDDPR
jgi:hypothetical protein